jgi:ribonucleoside-diphosphate reductase alpha chain
MPEAATAEDIEDVYLQGWKLGLKAIAIYRDGSKRSQPLSTGKKKDEGTATASSNAAEAAAPAVTLTGEPKPYRRRLPDERRAVTHKFQVAGHEGYITVGLYNDGMPGEIFLKMAKEGSTVSGLMDSLATMTSIALQYGVPLRDLVNKFAHVRFEPAGFTGNAEIPIAKSIVDYVFRWLGSRFLTQDEREQLGIISGSSTAGSASPLSFGAAAPAAALAPDIASPAAPEPEENSPTEAASTATAVAELPPAVNSEPSSSEFTAIAINLNPKPIGEPAHALSNGHSTNGNGNGNGHSNGAASSAVKAISASLGATTRVSFSVSADSPSCMDCGSIMVRNGSCYKCLNCGSTSGCS